MSKLCDSCVHQANCPDKDRLADMEEEFYDYVINRSELSKFNTGIFSVNVALVCDGYFSVVR